MKIAIVIRCCRIHGSSRYALEAVKHFADAGHEVHVFTNNWDEMDKRVIIHKVPTISNMMRVYEASFMLFSTLMIKLNKFDVTMAQPTRFFTPDVGYMQFVYRHWANYKCKEYGMPVSLANQYLAWMEGRNARRAKKIVAMSKVLKEQIMLNYDIPDDRIKIIYSGVDLDKFNPENRKLFRADIRKQLGLSESDVVMIFVGNPYQRKGLEYAVKALPLIPDKKVKLLVMGKDLGNDKIENYLKTAKELGQEGRLVYGGFTREIEKYYAAADLFLFPTLYEPFGLVILEALSAGLPAVVSRIAGAAELIENGKEGILLEKPSDEKEIAAAVNALLKNSIYKEFAKNARLKAEKYPWSRFGDEMLKVFEEVRAAKRK